jgi:NADPH2:quinone reductase
MTTMPTTTTTTMIPTTMNAVVIREYGGIESLSYERDFPVFPTNNHQLSKGQVLVKNKFCGLNFIDTYYRSGLYKQDLPFIVGQEGAGEVVMISDHNDDDDVSNPSDIKVGDVVAYSSLGTYCDYTAVDADKVVKIPDGISIEKALCCMVQGMTAHYLVTDALTGLAQPGDWMLIYSVGSGTCQWAAQMAKKLGYKVIGTTSRGKATESIQTTCDHLIVLDVMEGKTYADYNSVDIVRTVMEVTNGDGVKCILDGVGRNTADTSIQCLARRGLWISFGNASGPVPPISLLQLTAKSAYVTRPKLSDYIATHEELQSRANEVFQWVKSGDIDVTVDCIFPLSDVKVGHSYLEAGRSKGKVLFEMAETIGKEGGGSHS